MDEKIICGLIHGVHGVAGLLKVECLSDNPQRFLSGQKLYTLAPNQPEQEYTIIKASLHKGRILLKLANIDSPEQAAKLSGLYLYGIRQDNALPEGEYYHYQLIGLNVYENNELIGQISEVLTRPANDIYIIKTADEQEIWLPALKKLVQKIDLEQKTMQVILPEGL